MDEAKPDLPYDIEIIDFDGEVGIAVKVLYASNL
jgi:hypothetical protein